MPECDHCHAERNPLIHVQDMGKLADALKAPNLPASGPGPELDLEAKWCFPCLLKAAIEQCGSPDKW